MDNAILYFVWGEAPTILTGGWNRLPPDFGEDLADLLALGNQYGWLLVLLAFLLLNARRIADRMGPLFPPLAKMLERNRQNRVRREGRADEVDEAVLHHRLGAATIDQTHSIQLQDRMLTILEQSLNKFWEDREASRRDLEAIRREIEALKHEFWAHTQTINRLADEIGVKHSSIL